MSKNVLPNLKVWVCGGLLLIFSQTKGALGLGLVLGLGMLRSKLPGHLFCITPVWSWWQFWASGLKPVSETISALLAFKHLFFVFSYLRLAVRDNSWKSGLKWLGSFNSFVITLTNWCAGKAGRGEGWTSGLGRGGASTVCCFCLWNSLKLWRPSKSLSLLSSPASSAGDLWTSVKPEDPLKGIREFLWTLAAEQECPAAPGSSFGQRLCQLALWGRCPPFLFGLFGSQPFLLVQRLGWPSLMAQTTMKHSRKSELLILVQWWVLKETFFPLFFMQSSKDRNTFYSGSSHCHKNSYVLKAFKRPQSNAESSRLFSKPGEKPA